MVLAEPNCHTHADRRTLVFRILLELTAAQMGLGPAILPTPGQCRLKAKPQRSDKQFPLAPVGFKLTYGMVRQIIPVILPITCFTSFRRTAILLRLLSYGIPHEFK